jgi:hypothetical protein
MKSLLLLVTGIFLLHPVFSQNDSKRKEFEVSAGASMHVYQSVSSFQNSFGIEAGVRGKISSPLDWQAGLRLGMDPAPPGGFLRILGKQEMGAWRPGIRHRHSFFTFRPDAAPSACTRINS